MKERLQKEYQTQPQRLKTAIEYNRERKRVSTALNLGTVPVYAAYKSNPKEVFRNNRNLLLFLKGSACSDKAMYLPFVTLVFQNYGFGVLKLA